MSSRDKSTEEIKGEHLRILGPDLGSVYNALYQEVCWIHAKWAEYKKLFAKGKNRINLLRESASWFFYVIERCLREDILLHITRLTDPPSVGKRTNLTVQELQELITDATISLELKRLLKEVNDKCLFAREWRNKRLAHYDRKLALRKTMPLLPYSRKKIDEALLAIHDLLNLIERHYFNSYCCFDSPIVTSDADELVANLGTAVDTKKQRQLQNHQRMARN